MKYSDSNPPIKCYMKQSSWYKGSALAMPVGILWHCTGANNPNIKRYVQPDDNASDRIELIKIIGENTGKNDWNHITASVGVNAFIGKLADGSVGTVQTGPWTMRAWGCGKGKNGSCNDGWIQFEICEDNLTNKDYFNKCYNINLLTLDYVCLLTFTCLIKVNK